MTDKLFFTSEVIGDKYSTDPDSAGKSRKFYAKYWENTLSPNCTDYSTAGKAIYRGDTTISFNTIAGSVLRLVMTADMPQGSFARLQAIQSSELITDDLKRQFTEFQKLYHSLANFLPLPDDKWHRHTNMNTAKGHQPPIMIFRICSTKRSMIKCLVDRMQWLRNRSSRPTRV